MAQHSIQNELELLIMKMFSKLRIDNPPSVQVEVLSREEFFKNAKKRGAKLRKHVGGTFYKHTSKKDTCLVSIISEEHYAENVVKTGHEVGHILAERNLMEQYTSMKRSNLSEVLSTIEGEAQAYSFQALWSNTIAEKIFLV